MNRVGFWLRSLAALIDGMIVLFFLMLCLVLNTLLSGGLTLSPLLNGLLNAGIIVYTTTEVVFAGTPGKQILRIKIGRNDGKPADRWRLFLRWSTKQLPLILFVMYSATNWPPFDILRGISAGLLFIGCLYAANDDKLSWHDQWAGTAIYRARLLTPLRPTH